MAEHPATSVYAFDPELVEFAALTVQPAPVSAEAARERSRAYLDAMNVDVDTSGLAIDDRLIPGPEGAPEVTVRVYRPTAATAPVPAILYIHGGGFFVGSIDTEHMGSTALARELGVAVVSVDYRLAPEHPFPAGIEDCYAALVWVHDHAAELGIDTARIALNGGSAGGGLAAGLALLARDRGGPNLCFQYLGIPELDDRLDTPSMRRFHDTPMWARPAAEKSWEWYLGDAHDTDDVSPYAAPARAVDVAGLPPAYISTMEYDPLRDEGIFYALKLLEAGVSVELHSFPGTFHGSAIVSTAAVTRREGIERMAVWRRALGLDPA
jgi:acetyl esterase